MARRKEPADDELQLLIADSVRDLGDETAADVAARVMDALRPVMGAAAERRRSEGALRDAFREGYLTGQQAGRWNRWHALVWKHSALFRRLRAKEDQSVQSVAAAARYADLNY
jgi:hypothetical protein